METVVIANFYVFVVVGVIGIFIGLDPKKGASWLYGVYGFVSGLLFSVLSNDVSVGLKLGLIFALAVMYGGVISYWNRQRFKQ